MMDKAKILVVETEADTINRAKIVLEKEGCTLFAMSLLLCIVYIQMGDR